jgi:hypothetical protein
MPDGAFRVFWIGTLWCMLAVFWLPFTIRATRWQLVGYGIIGGSLLASYSRALWISVVSGVALALCARYRRHAPKLLGAVMLLFVGGVVANQSALISNRIGSLTAGELSVSARWDQLGPLVQRWHEYPWFGTGYGGTASVLRSQEAPFSYELVPLALLMKLGVVGMAGLATFWILLGGAAARLSSTARAEVASFAGASASFLLFSCSNPVFLNFVGLAVFGCLLFQIVDIRSHVKPERIANLE